MAPGGVLIEWDLGDRESYAFLAPHCLPRLLYNRATGWIPLTLRRLRNRTVVATAVEALFALASFSLGGMRGGIARIAAGLNGIMLIASIIGFLAALRCWRAILYVHCALVWTVLTVFVIFYVVSSQLSRSGNEADALLLILLFVFFVVDLIVGFFTFYLGRELGVYERHCASEDEVAGGAGRGVLERFRRVEGAVAEAARHAPVALPTGRVDPSAREALESLSAARRAESLASGPVPASREVTPAPTVISWRAEDPEAARVPAPATAGGSHAAGHIDLDDDSDSSRACPVCMVRPRNVAFVDCGHMLCAECAQEVRRRYGHCYLCRQRIVKILRLYEG